MGELSLILNNIDLYMLVFARMAGIILFNPLLSRNSIPAALRTAIAFGVTILITPMVPIPAGYDSGAIDFLLYFGKEIFIGFLLGYVFNVFYYMLITAGDILDMNFGFAMAKIFDPATNIQSAFTANILNLLFILYFFATNSHLVLIELAVSSYDLFSVGAGGLSLLSAAEFAVDIFGAVFGLALRLAIPFIAVEFILEISMGILMKLIPQIHVFVIEFQFKILLAILLLYVLANPISVFIDNYILIIFDYMHDALQAASG